MATGPAIRVTSLERWKLEEETPTEHEEEREEHCSPQTGNVADIQKPGRQRVRAYDGGYSPMLLTSIDRRKRQVEYFQ
jgi:hypothetical protein